MIAKNFLESGTGKIIRNVDQLDQFAVADGFLDWSDMVDCLLVRHGSLPFTGELIQWENRWWQWI